MISQGAKTIAMLGRILHQIRVPVCIVLKPNTKTKMINRIAKNAGLANITTKQVKKVAKNAGLANTTTKPVKRLNLLLVKNAALVIITAKPVKTVVKNAVPADTTIKPVKAVVKNAVPANTMAKKAKRQNLLLVKTIARPGRILHPIKVPACIVLKANTKTKMTNRIAKHAGLVNTTIKRVKHLNLLLAKTIAILDPTLTPIKVPV